MSFFHEWKNRKREFLLVSMRMMCGWYFLFQSQSRIMENLVSSSRNGWFSCFRTFVVVSIFSEFISSSATALLNITSFSCLYIDVLEIRNVFPGSLYWTSWLIDSLKAKTECIENGMAALIFFNFKQKTFPKKFCQQL